MSGIDAEFRAKVATALDYMVYTEALSPLSKKRKVIKEGLGKLLTTSRHLEPVDRVIHEYGFDQVLQEATRQARAEAIAQQQKLKAKKAAAKKAESQTATAAAETALVKVSAEPHLPDDKPSDEDASAISLPFIIQHRTLLALQSGIEQTCFSYAEESLPHILEERQWDCPEAAALPAWLSEFERHDSLAPITIEEFKQDILPVYGAVSDRRNISAEKLYRYITASITFATIFGDDACVKKFRYLEEAVLKQTEELEKSWKCHVAKLDDIKAEFAAKRKALDAEEATAVRRAKKEMTECKKKMVSDFKDAAIPDNLTNHEVEDAAGDDGALLGVEVLDT